MNGAAVGTWSVRRGEHHFVYAPSWLDAPLRRPLSLSMPLRPSSAPYNTEVVQPFFDNLLPDDEELRRRMQNRFGASSTAPFDLLAEVGRDCIGAVQLVPAGTTPPDVRPIRGRPLGPAGVAALLERVRAPLLTPDESDDFRISLAGAQEKTALLWHDGRWQVPLGATPSTHIFKLPIADFPHSVENEWLCAQLLPHFGIACAHCAMKTFGAQRVLVVERFDRRPEPRWIVRRPQEDLCQATATPPALKYESQGGPGILDVMSLLNGSSRAAADREDFFRTQFLFWLLCAVDGHAKNFSIFIEVNGAFALTPRYDVISAYPLLGRSSRQLSTHKVKMAMAVVGKNRHYRWKEIRVEHWLETGRRCGLPDVRSLIEGIVETTDEAIGAVKLPRGFPAAVSEPIFTGLHKAAALARSQLARGR